MAGNRVGIPSGTAIFGEQLSCNVSNVKKTKKN